MLISNILSKGIDVLLIGFSIYLFLAYFSIFFTRKKKKMALIIGLAIFSVTDIILDLPPYLHVALTIVDTLIAVMMIYEGKLWRKCIFAISFDVIWMLIETFSGYVLLIYFGQFEVLQMLAEFGSFVSKLVFLFVIIALKRVFTDDEIKDLPASYSIMLVLIPTGSIYIMNNIFMLCHRVDSMHANLNSAVVAVILLGMNILIFYIYIRLADDLRLKRMTVIYEQQLDLCERHQQEREMSMLQIRDVKHNMKNNLVSILAYAEKGENDKIISFVNEIMDDGGLKISPVTNSGNIVIDSLIGYWYVVAQEAGIDFTADICIPMKMPFKGADICLILGNLLENSVEAAQKADIKKYIRIKMKYDKNNLLLFVENSYNGCLSKTKDKKLRTTKSDAQNHGVGLSSVYRAAARYHGTVSIEDTVPNKFLARAVLYGGQE